MTKNWPPPIIGAMCLKAKEAGYVLAIDQASNAAGVSLWHNGNLIATTVLRSRSPADPFSRRLQHQLPQLTAFLDQHVPAEIEVKKVIFEGVKGRLVLITVGAFLCCPRISAKISESASFVYSSAWKSWARKNGATGPVSEIKGCKALAETGFDMQKHHIVSDDVADSILQYLCWKDKK